MHQPPSQQTAGAVRAELARHQKTAKQLAEHLGYKKTTMQRRLRGEYPFSLDELVLIAEFLDIPAATLVPSLRAA